MRAPRWAVALTLLTLAGAPALRADQPAADPLRPTTSEPITPIPAPPQAEPGKLALGQSLFMDRRLSHDGRSSCATCHDVASNGADGGREAVAHGGSGPALSTLTVFNAALNFRLNWEGDVRTLEAQAAASLSSPAMATSVEEVLGKLLNDPDSVSGFQNAYGRAPDRAALLDALATYERSLLTPGSRFDRWLQGESGALSERERTGYALFKSIGCVSCHQGVNVGGNLFERHGIFRPLAAPEPALLRVPSLRNVATTAPYFHDGSAPTLEDAVRKMAEAQLDETLSDEQVGEIVAFLGTLTGDFHGRHVQAHPP